MEIRNIARIFTPDEFHYVGNGFRVHTFFPDGHYMTLERMSPFFLLDYNAKVYMPPSDDSRGVGSHPHKGFETVTIAYKGKVEHHDSHGGGGIIGEGDVQWMTAASGVLHKEFIETEWNKQGGDFQMVQLWVNLPAAAKKEAPKYQALKNKDFKRHILSDDQGEVQVIAGKYKDTEGSAETFTPVHLMNAQLHKGGKADFEFPKNYNTALLVIEGNIQINDTKTAQTNDFVLMQNDGEVFRIEATEDALVLVMSGEPINEPIASYGPFVMNTRDEIIQAYEEFNQGKFGYLE